MVELPAGSGMVDTACRSAVSGGVISSGPTANHGQIKGPGETIRLRRGSGLSSREIGIREEIENGRNSAGLSWSRWTQ